MTNPNRTEQDNQPRKLRIVPINRDEANAFVLEHHRHHKPLPGAKFCIGVAREQIVGVAMVGRPIARYFDDGFSLEVTRVCVLEDQKNACSMLYGACWRAARAMGYLRLYTYTRADEPGSSLLGAGWKTIAKRPAKSWAGKKRLRVDKSEPFQRLLWLAQ